MLVVHGMVFNAFVGEYVSDDFLLKNGFVPVHYIQGHVRGELRHTFTIYQKPVQHTK